MTLAEALEMLSANDRERVETALRVFGECAAIYYRAVCSLECESRLLQDTWKGIFNVLLAIDPIDPNKICNALINYLRRRTLNGPPMTLFHPRSFGRAVTLEYFCRLLVEQGYFGSVHSAKRNIRSLLLKPREVVVRRWRHYCLGKYLMWSTFSTGAHQENPFDGIPNSADATRGILGLDPNERGEPLLLMIYSLPTNIIPRFPTIAEAFAGEKWNYFFTPAPAGAAYGMTLPWPEYQGQAPRPEVVHEVILGGSIISPLRKVL